MQEVKTEKLKRALDRAVKLKESRNDMDREDAAEHIFWLTAGYLDEIILSLKIADKLMQEPSDEMCKDLFAPLIPEGLYKNVRKQILKEIE